MAWIAFTTLVTAMLVVLVSELAKRNDKVGAWVAALPLVTVLTLVWLHVEKQAEAKLAAHAWYTFWYVLPTMPMFLLFPWLLPRTGFWLALLACIAVTGICFGAMAQLLRASGIDLLP